MKSDVLYLGETGMAGGAAYLAAVMRYSEITYNYVPADQSPRSQLDEEHRLLILSDYPAAMFASAEIELLVRKIRKGMGLFMIGGWDSYRGRNGRYEQTALAEILPVLMDERDDRLNSSSPFIVRQKASHQILDHLPFTSPPYVGGLNLVRVKPEADLLLTAVQYQAELQGGSFSFRTPKEHPLLILGQYGGGRISCFTSDSAPHWVGGLVDWGERRVQVEVDDLGIEVGEYYLSFFENIIRWTGKLS